MNHRCFSFRLKKTYSNFWWGELVKSASLPWERWRLAHCSPAAWPGRRRCVTSASCDDGLFCSVCETCNTRLTSQCSDHTIVVCGVKMWESKFDISASFSGNDTTTFFDAWTKAHTHTGGSADMSAGEDVASDDITTLLPAYCLIWRFP